MNPPLSAPPRPDSDRSLVRILAGWGVFALTGALFCIGYRFAGLHLTRGRIGNNMYHYLLVHFETVQLTVSGVVLLIAAWLTARCPVVLERFGLSVQRLSPRAAILKIGFVGFVISVVGTFTVYHNFDLCIDEYLPTFQAQLFARGQIFAYVPQEWREFAPAMTTTFLMYDPAGGRWTQVFLPVYAAIRAILSFVGLDRVTGALLLALSVYALVNSARRLWPEKSTLWILSALFLVSNTQVLVMGMTSYAWPAHLALNLVFLWFFLSGGVRFWIAPWVGFLAMGLHQPHVHPLFALPWVLWIAWQRRWIAFLYYSAVYLLAGAVWFAWLHMVRLNLPGGGTEGTFGIPDSSMLLLQWSNLGLLLAWSTPLLWVLVSVAWRHWRQLSPVAVNLSLGVLLSFAFYFSFPHDQGHGWGYRFLHGVLGNVALLAVFGWELIEARNRGRLLPGLLVLSLGFTVLWQLPFRLWEVDSVVTPYARASRALEAAPRDVAVLDAWTGWYAADLVRNDPFFTNRPKLMFLHKLSPELVDELQRRRSVTLVGDKQFQQFGIPPGLRRQPKQVSPSEPAPPQP